MFVRFIHLIIHQIVLEPGSSTNSQNAQRIIDAENLLGSVTPL
jgi:hypothetical protein